MLSGAVWALVEAPLELRYDFGTSTGRTRLDGFSRSAARRPPPSVDAANLWRVYDPVWLPRARWRRRSSTR
ncbi:MAG: hypothetical protein R3F59_22290 [Myxococcota bacterium]